MHSLILSYIAYKTSIYYFGYSKGVWKVGLAFGLIEEICKSLPFQKSIYTNDDRTWSIRAHNTLGFGPK